MSRSDHYSKTEPPWYRQFWPWFLIGLPAIVVAASLYSVWLAASGRDDLVADDYYREGLAINERLEAQQAARAGNITATLLYSGSGLDLDVTPAERAGEQLHLSLHHPLDASRDRDFTLESGGGGLFGYRGDLPDMSQRWYITVDGVDPASGLEWELRGEIRSGQAGGSTPLTP